MTLRNAPERKQTPLASFPKNLAGMPLALEPRAFGWLFFDPFTATENRRRDDGVIEVYIRGPLEHHSCWYADSYDAICGRFDAALDANPTGIVLCIDSPGGLVAGCFELAEHMKHECAEHGIPLYAYAEGMCCSAAYLLACAAQKIGASKSSMVGSIGVIDCLVDATAIDEMFGVKYRLITSGARKGDGNPHVAIDDGAVLATQQRVDDLAAQFFAWVGDARPSLGADGAKAIEAGVFIGSRASTMGLLDALGDPSVLLDESTSSTETTSMDPKLAKAEDEKPADDKKDDAPPASESDGDMYRKLRKMADEGDEDAKKMVKKLEGDDADEAKTEDDADEKKAEDDAEDAKALARRTDARLDRMEREQLMAQRPDLTAAERKLLASAPVSEVRAYVGAAPKRAIPDRAASQQPGVRPKAQPGKDRDALALTPPVTENDRKRHELAMRLTGMTSSVIGSRVERDASGRVAKVEFGVDREIEPGKRNPDRLAGQRLRGASSLGGITRVA
jgi:ClpP class serine protease